MSFTKGRFEEFDCCGVDDENKSECSEFFEWFINNGAVNFLRLSQKIKIKANCCQKEKSSKTRLKVHHIFIYIKHEARICIRASIIVATK